jgi:hypothetical protein
MTWYIHTLTKYRKEILSSAVVSVLFSSPYCFGNWAWEKLCLTNIEPISAPGLLERGFLYWIRFYQFLHGIVCWNILATGDFTKI